MYANGEDPKPERGVVREVYRPDRAARLEYSPELDGLADPGEIVWAWVPYEEDASRGKDRPLLVVGRNARGGLLAMMLTSRAPDHPAEFDDHVELGSGRWDRDGRQSYLRLDRVFELAEDDIRREGSILEPERFSLVVDAVRERHGWR